MGGGGKKGGGAADVTDYFLVVEFGICHGEVDALTEVKIDDRSVWSGEITEASTLTVFKPTLFGGAEKEGGVAGCIDFAPGGWNDPRNSWRGPYMGRQTQETPQYRGTCSAFMRGIDRADVGPFYWTTNLANIKPAAFRVRRSPKPPAPFPTNRRMVSESLANPAAVILEVLTSDEFGMWAPIANIDVNSFIDCANTLHDEAFGIALNWTKQEQIEDFVNLVLNHVAGTVFVSPLTGLVTMRLTRGGYDADSLPIFGPDDCNLLTYKRRSWGETVNEVIAKWRNPVNEKDETVSVQDGANIAMQGSLVSTTIDVPGVRDPNLALRVAQRELQTQSTPLANIRIEVDRKAFGLDPNQVFRFTWPRYGIGNMVFRVTRVDLGTLMNNTVTVDAIEDVFGMPQTSMFEDPGTEWVDGNEEPRPALHDTAFTLPYYFLANALGEAEIEAYEYPSALVGALATQDGADTFSYDLYTERLNNQGETVKTSIASPDLAGYGELGGALVQEVRSTVPFVNLLGSNKRGKPGAFVWIGKGTGTSDEGELCLIESRSGSEYTILRGILDTVPQNWPANTDIWLFDDVSLAVDLTERVEGERAYYWACPKTSLGILDVEDADRFFDDVNSRPYEAYRPGNVRVNNQLFPTELTETDLTITWAHRDKALETTVVQPFDAGNVGAPNVTYTVQIRNADNGNLIKEFTGITDTSVSYTALDEVADTGTVVENVRVLVWTEDPEYGRSWQTVEYEFTRPVPLWNIGWGNSWGNDFE